MVKMKPDFDLGQHPAIILLSLTFARPSIFNPQQFDPRFQLSVKSSRLVWSAMIQPNVCYVVATESRQGTHMTQPGQPMKENGCHCQWLEMQGQMPAAKQH
jgi:hypothetical protein